MGERRRRAVAIAMFLGLAAPLIVAGTSAAQGDPNSEINQTIGRFLLENGYQFDDPDKVEADLDAARTDVAGTTEPYDNFTNAPTDFDAADVEPQAIATVHVDPVELASGGPLIDTSFRLSDPPINAPPFTSDGWTQIITSSVDAADRDALADYAVGNDAPEVNIRNNPPVPSDFAGWPTLNDPTQNIIIDSLDDVLPFSPNQPRGWYVDSLFGPDSALGCGEHPDPGYTVFCDPSDPGGSQFANGATFVSLEIPAPVDAMGPPYGIEVVFTFADGTTAVYQGSFEGDFFNGSNHNYVLRFDNGLQFEHLEWNGTSWGPQPTTVRMVDGGNVITLVLDSSIDPAGIRISTFKTDGSRQPGRVASYSIPGPDQPLAPFQPVAISATPPAVVPLDLNDTSLYTDPTTVFASPDEPTVVPTPTETPISSGDDSDEATDIGGTSTGSGDGSNTTAIVLTLVGGTALVGGGYHFWRRSQTQPIPVDVPIYTQTLHITETLDFAPTPPITDTIDVAYPIPIPDTHDLTQTLPITNSMSITDTGFDTAGFTVGPVLDEYSWEPITLDDVDSHLDDATRLTAGDAPTVVEVDNEDTPDAPTSAQPDTSPFPPATGKGSWFRNNRAEQLHDQTGEWVDPATIALPRLLQRAFDEAPEPPTVITPEMAAARQGMFAGAAAAGLQLPGKALLTDSYDGPTGEPHMFWTVRVGADGSILDSWENAEKGGPVATAICRLEVYQTDPGVWWAFVKLVDTRTMRVFVANNPQSADPSQPRPRPTTPEEAMRLSLTGLVSDGKFVQPMDPRLTPPGP